MLLSTSTEVLQKFYGYEETIRKLAAVGFDAFDFTMAGMGDEILKDGDYVKKAESLRALADSLDIRCNQTHSPFPVHKNGHPEWDKAVFDAIVRCLEISHILGAKRCIVHPWNDWSAAENVEKVYRPLQKHAEKFGVKICLENMWNWDWDNKIHGRALPAACSHSEDFLKHLGLLDPEWFAACLDIGHAEMYPDTSAEEMIYALGDRLEALHIHDNDCMHDWHYFPYMGKINYEKVFAALKAVNYAGDFTFEADYTYLRYPRELCGDLVSLLYKTGRYMIKQITE